MDNTTILDKIRLILKKASNNPYPEEAESCMLKAQALLAAHGLEMQDVPMGKAAVKEIDYFEGTSYRRIPWYYWQVSSLVADNFRCYCIRFRSGGASKVMFFGERRDADIAISVFQFAVDSIDRHSKAYTKAYSKCMDQKHRNALRNDYIRGYIKGMGDKFAEQVAANRQWALVLAKDQDVVAAHEKKHLSAYKATPVNTLRNASALNAGYAKGREFQPVAHHVLA